MYWTLSVDAFGNWTTGELAAFEYLGSGIYNGIWAMVRELNGKIVTAGYGAHVNVTRKRPPRRFMCRALSSANA